MPILPILCVCENLEWVMFALEIFKGIKMYNDPMVSSSEANAREGHPD